MIRLPKIVTVNNIPFTVVKDRKFMGGRLDYETSTITVGTKNLADCEILENFIHEVAEISTIERGMRSSRCKSSNTSLEYVFTGEHRQFADMIADVIETANRIDFLTISLKTPGVDALSLVSATTISWFPLP